MKNRLFDFFPVLPIALLVAFHSTPCMASVDVVMEMNNGGYGSFDHFKAGLYLNNQGNSLTSVQIYGLIDIMGSYFFWPSFTTEVHSEVMDLNEGETVIPFLEFDFPDIEAFIPFGPMFFWGAWYQSGESYGYDVSEFWLDPGHRWTPTPTPSPVFTDTPTAIPATPTCTPQISTMTPTQTFPPTSTPTFTPVPDTPTSTPTVFGPGMLYSVDDIAGNMRLVLHTADSGYEQGSMEDEPCRGSNETQFTHVLTRSFVMMETEVSRQMWSDLKSFQPELPDDPSDQPSSPEMSYPVQSATWFECVLFANLLSAQNGFLPCYYSDEEFTVVIDETNYSTGPFCLDWDASGYRLATEGEWEYACRADTLGPFYCEEENYTSDNCLTCTVGSHPVLEEYCTYCANDSGRTDPAGFKMRNPWNLENLHGNIREWCWDWYHPYPSGTVTDYIGDYIVNYRVYRGGSYNTYANNCRSAARFNAQPSARLHSLGFRLVRTVEMEFRN